MKQSDFEKDKTEQDGEELNYNNKNNDETSNSYNTLIYSQDLIIDSFNLDNMLGHTLASLCIGPMRLTTRVATNLALLSPFYFLKFVQNILIIDLYLFILSLIQSFFTKSYYFPIVTFLLFILFGVLYKYVESFESAEQNDRELNIDTDSIEQSCNEIYNILDSILEEEFK